MPKSETRVHLSPAMFAERECPLVTHGPLTASAFRFESGVAGLRLTSDTGELVMLPFQGQQVWSAKFAGRDLTMKSMFPQPRPTREFLETYGAFLVHCGFTAMGVPGPQDQHPPHGEAPNAPYDHVFLAPGEDERGAFFGVGGQYRHTVAFAHNYLAEPFLKLYAGATTFDVSVTVTNLKATPQELMYLAHINFLPVDGSRLVYSAVCTPEHVRIRPDIPKVAAPGSEFAALVKALETDPARHELIKPGLAFDPELVLNIDYSADGDGWAHTMQLHPDGQADYVAHRPDQLKVGVRWICRTPDQDAMGMVLPATAESEGYTTEKARGNLVQIPPHGRYVCEYRVGVLDKGAAAAMERTIRGIVEHRFPMSGNPEVWFATSGGRVRPAGQARVTQDGDRRE